MASTATALTIVDRVEQSPAVIQLDARSQALVELLPDAAAATRFKRLVVQALVKNPELLECTPESVVLSVFEAAAQGLEPTGAAGGAHLVPYKVNVGSKDQPRYERRAQLIPDYRGVIRLVTKPPSEVVSLEARVVKEGDEFAYELGSQADVHHIPSLAAARSEKATTHVYAIARLKNGERIPDVMDRAEVERIQKRGRGNAFSPWATDWDEMAKKTVIKRIAKVLPVRPEIRSILVREDEIEDEAPATSVPTGGSKVSRLAQRLGTAPVLADPPEPDDDTVEGSFTEAPVEAAADASEPTLADTLRAAAIADGRTERAAQADVVGILTSTFKDWNRELVLDGLRAVWGKEGVDKPTAAQVAALKAVGEAMPPAQLVAAWHEMVGGAA